MILPSQFPFNPLHLITNIYMLTDIINVLELIDLINKINYIFRKLFT